MSETFTEVGGDVGSRNGGANAPTSTPPREGGKTPSRFAKHVEHGGCFITLIPVRDPGKEISFFLAGPQRECESRVRRRIVDKLK
jgi:hypothetical protein